MIGCSFNNYLLVFHARYLVVCQLRLPTVPYHLFGRLIDTNDTANGELLMPMLWCSLAKQFCLQVDDSIADIDSCAARLVCIYRCEETMNLSVPEL
jgi:hypothetical protein